MSAPQDIRLSSAEDIRESVRRRYAEAASRAASADPDHGPVVETSCCGGAKASASEQGTAVETSCCGGAKASASEQGTAVETSCCGGAKASTAESGLLAESSCCGGASAVTTDRKTLAVETSCCGGAPVATTDEQGREVFGAELYGSEAGLGAPDAAVAASLGCGVPTAVADLHPGEVVLDLGSGAGADVLISARRVAPGGRVIGLDMTVEMLDLARRNAADAGVDNVEFVQGYLEDIPLPDDSVDVVISNCVLNLAADKNVVLAEAARVLRQGGRLAFSDVIADEGMDETTKADMAEWTGCIAGALTHTEFTDALAAAGFTDIEIRPTHRVHAYAQAAIIRATH